MSSKRNREDGEREAQPAAKFLITGRVFTCKTCNKEFSTFQALGGHCASFKNRNPIGADRAQGSVTSELHKCKICGEEFPLGQALGGHMTKHRSKQTTDAADSSKSGLTVQEKFHGEESEYDSSMHRTVLVTRDFFPLEPVRIIAVPAEPVPFWENPRNPWLDLKLGLPGDYKEN